MTVDIRIHGGTVHLPSGPVVADLLITGEQISGIVTPEEQTKARRTMTTSCRSC